MKTLLDSLHLAKANVVGWSDGGNTGLLMTLHYPTYVQRLITTGANLFPTTEAVEAKMLRQSGEGRKFLAKKGDVAQERLLTLVLTVRWSSKNREWQVLPSTAHARHQQSERLAADPQKIYTRL